MRLTLLYIVLSACGLLIFGFSPANATLLYLYKEKGSQIADYTFSEAFAYFKQQFWKANISFFFSTGLALFFLYTLWLYTQITQSIWLLIGLVLQISFFLFSLSMYGVYLVLQIYYEGSVLEQLKLSAIGVFLDFQATVKWLIGTGLCVFLGMKLPLILVVFLPCIWLLFSSDILHCIYQKIEKKLF
ncbi:DUF624 domain-containing protein [Streptococcus cameli]